jgi:hypothetical protein
VESGRSRGIVETTWALSILNLLVAFASIDWRKQPDPSNLAITSIVVVVRFIVIWFYLNGYPWARILVMLASLAALWNLTSWMNVTIFARVVIALKAVMGLFLLYWLNTHPAKKYFDPRPTTLL